MPGTKGSFGLDGSSEWSSEGPGCLAAAPVTLWQGVVMRTPGDTPTNWYMYRHTLVTCTGETNDWYKYMYRAQNTCGKCIAQKLPLAPGVALDLRGGEINSTPLFLRVLRRTQGHPLRRGLFLLAVWRKSGGGIYRSHWRDLPLRLGIVFVRPVTTTTGTQGRNHPMIPSDPRCFVACSCARKCIFPRASPSPLVFLSLRFLQTLSCKRGGAYLHRRRTMQSRMQAARQPDSKPATKPCS